MRPGNCLAGLTGGCPGPRKRGRVQPPDLFGLQPNEGNPVLPTLLAMSDCSCALVSGVPCRASGLIATAGL